MNTRVCQPGMQYLTSPNVDDHVINDHQILWTLFRVWVAIIEAVVQ